MEPDEPLSARYETACELGKRIGHTDTVVCTDCGAFVMNVAAHDRFHAWLGPIPPEPADEPEPGAPLPDPRRWDYPLGLNFPLYGTNRPLPVRLFTGKPDRPSILGAGRGDVIEVIQPDGTREHYRIASAAPTADGLGTAFQMERQP